MIVEQIIEEIIQIPKIIPQRRVQQWSVEQIVVVLVTITNHHCHHYVEKKLYVDVLAPHEMEEIAHAPKMIP